MKKRKVVVYEELGKFYMTNYENFHYNWLNKLEIVEMQGFNSLKECKKYLEKNFEYEVILIN